MATLRFISDSAHGWLEVPTVDVAAAGVTPSRYSYIDATNGMTYLEEDRDAMRYAVAMQGRGCSNVYIDSNRNVRAFKDVYIEGDCWIRDLPPAA